MINVDNSVVKDIIKAVRSIESTAEVILFGSRSRGDAKKNSDYDLLLLTEKDVSLNYENRFLDALFEVELEHGIIIQSFLFSKDLWVSNVTPSPLIKSVREEGNFL